MPALYWTMFATCLIWSCGGSVHEDKSDAILEVLTDSHQIPPGLALDPTVNLPDLRHGQAVTAAVLLSASTTHISVDGVRVQSLVTGSDGRIQVPAPDRRGNLIESVLDVLEIKAETARYYEKKMTKSAEGNAVAQDDHTFHGRLLLELDKSLPPSLIQQLIYTAGQARFWEMRFLGRHPSTQRLLSTPSNHLPLLVQNGKIEAALSDTQKEKLFGPQLSLSIKKDGFSLFSQGHAVMAFGTGSLKTHTTLPCQGSCSDIDAYPWDELTKVLASFRSEFPADCTTPVRVTTTKESHHQKTKKPVPDVLPADTSPETRLLRSLSILVPASPLEHGFVPTTCMLLVGLDGRPDLSWPWLMRLDDELANRAIFPHWVLTDDTSPDEETAPDFWVSPLCEDAQCSSFFATIIHEDPVGSGQGAWGLPFRNKNLFELGK